MIDMALHKMAGGLSNYKTTTHILSTRHLPQQCQDFLHSLKLNSKNAFKNNQQVNRVEGYDEGDHCNVGRGSFE